MTNTDIKRAMVVVSNAAEELVNMQGFDAPPAPEILEACEGLRIIYQRLEASLADESA